MPSFTTAASSTGTSDGFRRDAPRGPPGRMLQCPATNRSPATFSRRIRSASLARCHTKCDPEDRATEASTNQPSGPSVTAQSPSRFAQAGISAGRFSVSRFDAGSRPEDLPRLFFVPRSGFRRDGLRGFPAAALKDLLPVLPSCAGPQPSSWQWPV